MKRLIIVVALISVMLSGCSFLNLKDSDNDSLVDNKENTVASVWLSFSEINSILNSPNGFEEELKTVVNNCKTLNISNVYIHVRAFCDSLFESKYFPKTDAALNFDYDVFEKMIDAFHKKDIKVHAWINPYRVLTSSSNIIDLNTKSPAYIWLNDSNLENDTNVCLYNGIYLNPAEYEVRQLVINGIREIIELYDVDGIHFDDYFYPTTDEEFDKKSYENYIATSENPLDLQEWRRANVNALISSCYTAIKFLNKDLIFSISPAASTEKNYNKLYADVITWVENDCIDLIIPQIYFGFDYPTDEFKFENLLETWKDISRINENVELHIGLASYKIGTDTEPDNLEWQNSDDIISRQVKLCENDAEVDGYVYFSYSSLFSEAEPNKKQRNNLLKLFKEEDLNG